MTNTREESWPSEKSKDPTLHFFHLLVNVLCFFIRYEKKAVLNNLLVTKYYHKEFIKFESTNSS